MGNSVHTNAGGMYVHRCFSTPVKTSPPQALLLASSWTSDITLAEAGRSHSSWRGVSWGSKESGLIPTVLLIALVGAIVFPRHWLWTGTAATVAWAVMVLLEGSTESPVQFLGSVAAGAANATAVLFGAWFVRGAALSD